MEDFINCSVCKEFLLEGSAYGYVHEGITGELKLDYGHEDCLKSLMPQSNHKQIIIHPAALNHNDPLYIGYVGDR